MADLRDDRARVSAAFLPPASLPALAARAALDSFVNYEDLTMLLNSLPGSELIYVLGSARNPQQLLDEMQRVRIITSPALAMDSPLLVWALANPNITAPVRRHMLEMADPAAIAAAHHAGAVGLLDLWDWLRPTRSSIGLQRILRVLLLPPGPGVRILQRAALPAVDNVGELLAQTPSRYWPKFAELAAGSTAEPTTMDATLELAPLWHGDTRSLIRAVQAFSCVQSS
jgi:hypothetical protein